MTSTSPVVTDTNAVSRGQRLTVVRFVLLGSVGFAAVSLGGFAIWAFAGRWLGDRVGEAGMYAVSALVFVVLSGLFMRPLMVGPRPLPRFYRAFIPAFLAYAAVWSVAWFSMGFGVGEWIGSLLGVIVLAALLGRALGSYRAFLAVCLFLFVAHSLGYFLGGELYYWSNKREAAEMFSGFSRRQIALCGRMAWGLLYGLGFGAGLGYAFFKFQTPARQM